MRKAHGLRIGLGIMLLGAVVAPLHAADEIKVTPGQARAMGVATAALGGAGAAAARPLPARVVIPNHQLHIVSAPLAGLVESMAASPSQAVRKGQALARLQSPALVEIERGLLQAATQAQLAHDSLSRDEKLFRDGIIPESRYLAARARHAEASAALSERRQALRLAGLGESAVQALERGHAMSGSFDVVAPVNGVVLEQMAMPGQRTEAATPLYKVAQLVPLWLDIQVPIAQVAGLQPGVAVTVASQRAAGKVIQIGRAVEEGSQTVTVRAEIAQGAENLRPGQFVEASLASGAGGRQWLVPNAALARLRDQPYVFVQTNAGFRPQAVRLAGESGGGTLVSGEFKGDERVAVSGSSSLKALWQGLAAGGE